MTILITNRPESYMSIGEIEYILGNFRKNAIFRIRTCDNFCRIGAFEKYENNILYYVDIPNALRNRKFKEKPNLV